MSSIYFVPVPAAKPQFHTIVVRRVSGVRLPNQLRRLTRQLRSATRGWSQAARIPLSWRAKHDLIAVAQSITARNRLEQPMCHSTSAITILECLILPKVSTVRASAFGIIAPDLEQSLSRS